MFRLPWRNNASGQKETKVVVKSFMKTFKQTSKKPVSSSHIPISWLFSKIQEVIFKGVQTSYTLI